MSDLTEDEYDLRAIDQSGGMLRRSGGTLLVEEVAASDLLERFGSPLYVISESTLRQRFSRIRAAFGAAWPYGAVTVLPSVKANPIVAVQRVLAQEGAGADLVHGNELEVAVRAGTHPGRISLNGSGKDFATVSRAVAMGARITVDDVRELELARQAARDLGRRAKISVRLRPLVQTTATIQTTDISMAEVYGIYKSGIPYDDLAEAGKLITAPELDVVGVMMHMCRCTTDLDVISQFSRRFGELTAELTDLWQGWSPQSIDIGGGLAAPGDGWGRARSASAGLPPVPEIEDYADAICAALSAGIGTAFPLAGRSLEVEPGRSLFAPCGVHLATVLNVKREATPSQQTWFETDTSVNFLADIIASWARPPVVPVELTEGADLDQGRIVGHSCQIDVVVPRIVLPSVRRGDALAFCFTGAYHEAGSTNFNVLSRPATVLVNGAQAHLVRRRETVEDVLGRDVVPDHLAVLPELTG